MNNVTKIRVNASGCYDILLGSGILQEIGKAVSERFSKCSIAILSDDKVFPIYGETVMESLRNEGFTVTSYVIPNGEASKNLDTLTGFINHMADAHITRTDAVLALGGGVVGDMAGFAASIFLRGIKYIQVPTTLLAAVDSSVGGKTAVDISAGKNLIGAFHQPSLVYCDSDTLQTLDPNVLRDGFAEVIKYGVILDKDLFKVVSRPGQADINIVIARCISIKRDVVEADEFDRGMRGLLNFGHTLGHAIEKQSNYTVTHGSAVAKGMVIAARIGAAYGMPDYTEEISRVLVDYGFDITCPYNAEQLYASALSDKKRSGSDITLILPREMGACSLEKMPATRVLELLKQIGL